MAKVIARVGGVAIAPGVSLNRRWYTREMLAAAVARAQDRIAGGQQLTLRDAQDAGWDAHELTQKTHHDAEDDSTRIVGRITGLSLGEQGEVRFTADIAGTPHGQTIASLVDTSDGQPAFLKGVSIRGAWLGKVRRVTGPDGQPAERGDGLDLAGLDYTGTPGVTAAQVDTFAWVRDGQDETTERVYITESVQEARVTISEDTTPTVDAGTIPAGPPEGLLEAVRLLIGDPPDPDSGEAAEADGTPAMSKRGKGLAGSGRVWADPGYQADKKQRYDITTKGAAVTAWRFISQSSKAAKYTPNQLKRVKGRIKAALAKSGVKVSSEHAPGWGFSEAVQLAGPVLEWMGEDPSRAGSWCVSASNGPVNLSLSSYSMDPADLNVILRAAADAACKALAALDPDMDGDVDVPGAASGDTDGDGGRETAPPAQDPAGEPDRPVPAAENGPAPAGHNEREDSEMSDATTNEGGAAPAGLSPEALEAIGTAAARAAAEAVTVALGARDDADRARRKEEKRARRAQEAAAAAAAVASAGTPAAAPATTEAAPAPPAPPAPAAEAAGLTTEQVDALVTERVQSMVASGQIAVTRTGLNPGGANEHRTPAATGSPDELTPATGEELQKMSEDGLTDYAGSHLDNYVFGGRGKAVHAPAT